MTRLADRLKNVEKAWNGGNGRTHFTIHIGNDKTDEDFLNEAREAGETELTIITIGENGGSRTFLYDQAQNKWRKR